MITLSHFRRHPRRRPASRLASFTTSRAALGLTSLLLVGGTAEVLAQSADGQPAAPADKPEAKPTDPPTGKASEPTPAAAGSQDSVAEGDTLMAKRTLKGYRAAVDAYDAALKAKPDDLDLKLKLVTALNAVMRAQTHGNLLTMEGPGDTAENKKLWSKLGTRSEALGKDVVAARPKDLEAQLQYAEAYMYRSGSFGFITAILKGAADQYKANANTLIDLDKSADGGVGYVYLGGFYTVAPWPLSDADTARSMYDKALKLAPNSIRNRYYRGLRAYHDEEWDLAAEHLQFAVDKPCTLASEKDFCKYMKQQAQRTLDAVAKKR